MIYCEGLVKIYKTDVVEDNVARYNKKMTYPARAGFSAYRNRP